MIIVYLASPVSDYQRNWNLVVADALRQSGFIVYLPQEITPKDVEHTHYSMTIYERCLEMIQSSDLGLLLLPYGRDCAWEAGYYKGLNKPLFIFAKELDVYQHDRLRDWMVKGGVDELITTSKKTVKILKNDPILGAKKVTHIKKLSHLPEKLAEIYKNHKKTMNPAFLGVGAVVTNEDRVLMVQEKEDCQFYLRKKGMWGFPTTLFYKDTPPEKHSLYSLHKETNLRGEQPRFICKESIPNAVGLFYKVDVESDKSLRNGRWVNVNEVIKEKMYLRPKYARVLRTLFRS